MTQSLRHRLTEAAQGTGSTRALASYMLNALPELPFLSAAALGDKVGVSEATVGRFCRQLGYANLRDLKAHLRDDIGDAPWLLSDRLHELRGSDGEEALARGLELEIAGLVRIYEQARSPDWARTAERLARARQVFVAGFQTERGIAQYFAVQLQYLRDGVRLVDLAAGNFAEVLLSDIPAEDTCLIVFEGRRYSRLAKVLTAEAHALGIPVTLITDGFCGWDTRLTDATFRAATQVNQFWDSTAQMAVLGNLLIHSVFLCIGPEVAGRLERVSKLYAATIGHVGDPVGGLKS